MPATTDAALLNTVGADFLLGHVDVPRQPKPERGRLLRQHQQPDRRPARTTRSVCSIDYPNDPWSSKFLYREIQEQLQRARSGSRRARAIAVWRPESAYTARPNQHPWIRSVEFGVDAAFQMDTINNGLLDRELDARLLQVNTHSQDEFEIHVVPTYERLERDFRIESLSNT